MESIEFDIWSVLLSLGIFQGVFILPLLFKRKGKAGFWLGMLVLIISALLTNHLLINLRLYRVWPHFADITVPFIFLIAPFYYFYIRHLLNGRYKFLKRDIFHFTLFFAAIFYRFEFYFLSTNDKIAYLDWTLNQESFSVGVTFLFPIGLHVLQCLFYMALVYKILKIRKGSGNEINLKFNRWLIRFNSGFATYWVLTLIWMMYLTSVKGISHKVDYIFVLLTAVLIHLLAYTAIYHQRDFNHYLLAFIQEKYKKSSLSSEQSGAILKRLLKLMDEEKLYLNPNLKIYDLAKEMRVTTNILSQVLNQELKKNFSDFINEYRIEEAMKKLSDPKFSHYSIFGIAKDSGFNNKNTFNRLFKKHNNQTPSQYLKQMKYS